MTSLKQQSAKAVAWDFAGKIAGQTVSFVISIFLARLLSPEDFGLLAMANVVIALSSSLIDMGLGVALIQRKDVSDAHYGSVFFFNITLGLFLTLTLFFCAPLVAKFYDREILLPIVRAMSVLFLLSSIGNVIRSKLRKELEYGIPTKGSLISAMISGTVGVTMAFCGFGVWSLVTQALINPVISNVYLFYKVKWRPKLIFKWQALKELWGFGFRMFLSGVLDTLTTNADSLIIGKIFSEATLGFYYRARSLNNYIVQYSSRSIMSVLMPAFSKIHNDLEHFRSVIFRGYHIINFLAFFLTGLFFVIGDALILFLFGEKWEEAIPMFRLIILTAYGYPLSSLLVNILSASGNSKAFLRLEIIKKIASISALALGFFWGIKGYLICKIFATLIGIYFNMLFAGKQIKTNVWYFIKISLQYLIVAGLFASGLFLGLKYLHVSNFIQIVTGTILFSFFFTGVAWLLKLQGIVQIVNEIKGIEKIQRFLPKRWRTTKSSKEGNR